MRPPLKAGHETSAPLGCDHRGRACQVNEPCYVGDRGSSVLRNCRSWLTLQSLARSPNAKVVMGVPQPLLWKRWQAASNQVNAGHRPS